MEGHQGTHPLPKPKAPSRFSSKLNLKALKTRTSLPTFFSSSSSSNTASKKTRKLIPGPPPPEQQEGATDAEQAEKAAWAREIEEARARERRNNGPPQSDNEQHQARPQMHMRAQSANDLATPPILTGSGENRESMSDVSRSSFSQPAYGVINSAIAVKPRSPPALVDIPGPISRRRKQASLEALLEVQERDNAARDALAREIAASGAIEEEVVARPESSASTVGSRSVSGRPESVNTVGSRVSGRPESANTFRSRPISETPPPSTGTPSTITSESTSPAGPAPMLGEPERSMTRKRSDRALKEVLKRQQEEDERVARLEDFSDLPPDFLHEPFFHPASSGSSPATPSLPMSSRGPGITTIVIPAAELENTETPAELHHYHVPAVTIRDEAIPSVLIPGPHNHRQSHGDVALAKMVEKGKENLRQKTPSPAPVQEPETPIVQNENRPASMFVTATAVDPVRRAERRKSTPAAVESEQAPANTLPTIVVRAPTDAASRARVRAATFTHPVIDPDPMPEIPQKFHESTYEDQPPTPTTPSRPVSRGRSASAPAEVPTETGHYTLQYSGGTPMLPNIEIDERGLVFADFMLDPILEIPEGPVVDAGFFPPQPLMAPGSPASPSSPYVEYTPERFFPPPLPPKELSLPHSPVDVPAVSPPLPPKPIQYVAPASAEVLTAHEITTVINTLPPVGLGVLGDMGGKVPELHPDQPDAVELWEHDPILPQREIVVEEESEDEEGEYDAGMATLMPTLLEEEEEEEDDKSETSWGYRFEEREETVVAENREIDTAAIQQEEGGPENMQTAEDYFGHESAGKWDQGIYVPIPAAEEAKSPREDLTVEVPSPPATMNTAPVQSPPALPAAPQSQSQPQSQSPSSSQSSTSPPPPSPSSTPSTTSTTPTSPFSGSGASPKKRPPPPPKPSHLRSRSPSDQISPPLPLTSHPASLPNSRPTSLSTPEQAPRPTSLPAPEKAPKPASPSPATTPTSHFQPGLGPAVDRVRNALAAGHQRRASAGSMASVGSNSSSLAGEKEQRLEEREREREMGQGSAGSSARSSFSSMRNDDGTPPWKRSGSVLRKPVPVSAQVSVQVAAGR
ncbi:hypothetical protein EDC01DRAFT_638350 [Geopyxis carbonaria]|nr:hypothetical protein EDC01DRAFT_638350 [Geopyxis carbonaria]